MENIEDVSFELEQEEPEDDIETKKMFQKYNKQLKEVQKRQKEEEEKNGMCSILTVDVKPKDDQISPETLIQKVKELEIEGVKWLSFKTFDVAYGIQAITVQCKFVNKMIDSDSIQEKIETIQEVGSTDIRNVQMA